MYVVKINPHQKGEWGGTSYKNIIVISNINISPENLRILVHNELDVPYFKLYQFLFHDANPEKDMCNNIIAEQFKIDVLSPVSNKKYINELNASEFYELSLLSNYELTFPDGAMFYEKDNDWCMKLLDTEYKNAENNRRLAKLESDKQALKQFLSDIDKTTLLEVLQETLKERSSDNEQC